MLFAASTVGSVAAEPPVVKSHKPKHNHRWHVAMTLKRGLEGTPLAREYWHLEAAGHRWNVSPYLVAGIAGTESSFGAAACGGNAWGIASCGITFSTWNQGIRYTTRLLRQDYDLSSLYAIGSRYCPGTASDWAYKTGLHMRRFGANGDWLTYPG